MFSVYTHVAQASAGKTCNYFSQACKKYETNCGTQSLSTLSIKELINVVCSLK